MPGILQNAPYTLRCNQATNFTRHWRRNSYSDVARVDQQVYLSGA